MQHPSSLAVLLVASLVFCCQGQLTDFFTPVDVAETVAVVKGASQDAGDLDAVFDCALAVRVNACEIPESVVSSLKLSSALGAALKAKNMEHIYKAFLSLLTVGGMNSSEDASSTFKAVQSLYHGRVGLFQSSAAAQATPEATWMALAVLDALYSTPLKEEAALPKFANKVVVGLNSAIDDLDNADSNSEPLSLGEANPALTTGWFVHHLHALANSMGKSSSTLEAFLYPRFGKFLLSVRHTDDAATLAAVLSGLQALDSTVFAVSVMPTTLPDIQQTEGATVKISPVTLLGKPHPSTVAVTAAVAVVGSSKTSLELSQAGANWLAQVPADLAPAHYSLKFKVKFNGESSTIATPLLLTTEVKVENLFIVMGDMKVDQSKATKVGNHPAKASKVLQATSDDYAHVGFSVKAKSGGADVHPKQAVVVFTHVETGHDVYFAAMHKAGKFLMSISLGNEKAFDYHNGDYKVSLLIGDRTVTNPIKWHFANVKLDFGDRPPRAVLPLYYESLLHESDVSKAPLREINHVFRSPESRPPVVVSLAFSAGLVVLLAGLLVALPKAGGNLKSLPMSINNLVFLALLLATLVLYGVFWFSMTLFGLLNVLTPLSVLLVIFGRLALTEHEHASKLGDAKKNKSL